MAKKDLIFYAAILLLLILFLWQWLSKGALISQTTNLQKHNNQLQLLSGIGQLGSQHIHSDVKVYINGQAIDFSQRKYQLASSYIHFEEGIGDVFHVHATGMTIGHLFKSLRGDMNTNCITLEGQNYCNEKDKKLKFYVDGQLNNEFGNHIIKDLDKYLVSYGNENDSELKQQLSSVTTLAQGYSMQKS